MRRGGEDTQRLGDKRGGRDGVYVENWMKESSFLFIPLSLSERRHVM
jgi:hypothetical protein